MSDLDELRFVLFLVVRATFEEILVVIHRLLIKL
jgi:hypothetical protein